MSWARCCPLRGLWSPQLSQQLGHLNTRRALWGAKKTLTEDPIVRHFADDDVATESDAEGAGATPPPPGIGDSPPPGTAGVPTSAIGTVVGVSRSPGTPTKDELVVEDASRPQDPRRRKAVASALQSASASSPAAAVSPLVTVSSSSGTTSGSQLGAKSASELMEMARKQLEEMEVPPPPSVAVQQPQLQQPIAAPAAPPPPPVYGAPLPASMPPAGMSPAGMYGPPPPLDPSAYGAPPGVMPPGVVPPGYPPPPPPQWSTAGDPYWKGPPPPPQAGWNGGGRSGEYRQRGGPPRWLEGPQEPVGTLNPLLSERKPAGLCLVPRALKRSGACLQEGLPCQSRWPPLCPVPQHSSHWEHATLEGRTCTHCTASLSTL
ncbi:hypothetical protein MTO96_023992 [Rhipicephalus appendiculatus]